MYKQAIETETSIRGLMTIEMDERKTEVDIYIREAVDCTIREQAHIDITPSMFLELVTPILQAMGCRISVNQELI